VAAVAFAWPGLFACNAILGFGDYTKGECAGGACAMLEDAMMDVAMADVVVLDGGDAAVDVAKGADPVSWARWQMPNWSSDGGPILGPSPVFKGMGEDAVEEALTGLVWRRHDTSDTRGKTFAQAQMYCAGLVGGWRLPKRIELVTLLDFGHGAPFIDPAAFPDTANERVWTSSEARPYTGAADQGYWTVDFGSGLVRTVSVKNNLASVRCVRGKAGT